MDDLNRRLRRKAMEQDNLPDLPPPEPFIPYATIFKLEPPGEAARKTVRCLECHAPYLLSDLLEGELNNDQCPTCKTWALQYFKSKPHRKVPQ